MRGLDYTSWAASSKFIMLIFGLLRAYLYKVEDFFIILKSIISWLLNGTSYLGLGKAYLSSF